MEIRRELTAISRKKFSLPIQAAISDGIIDPSRTIFDYGCGRGTDVCLLHQMGIQASGWDPVHRPNASIEPADIVNLGYVINVIEHLNERAETLKKAFNLAKCVLIVSVLFDTESNRAIRAMPHGDGVLTSRGTFQKYYSQLELKTFVKETLGMEPVSARLGIIYVFHDETEKQLFLATRVRRIDFESHKKPIALEERYQAAKQILQKFIGVVENLGRLPNEDEFDSASVAELKLKIGSFSKAFQLIKHIFPDSAIEERGQQRKNDLLVYLALSRFQSRPPLNLLAKTLQHDMRVFFGGYSNACEEADKLLFCAGKAELIDKACADSKIGKVLPSDLYIHKKYIDHLSPILRVYVGCAQVLIGEIPDANIVKIHRLTGKVSYLVYEKFGVKAHPELKEATTVFLKTLEIKKRSYQCSGNPPILHRKETLLLPNFPHYEKFKKLTKQEDAAGLLSEPSNIGFKIQWEERLQERGYAIHGHSLRKMERKQE